MHQTLGKIIMLFGVFLLICGVIVYFAGDKLKWIGHLPGDIRIEKDNFRLYFPIVTMLLLSILLTIILHFIRKFF